MTTPPRFAPLANLRSALPVLLAATALLAALAALVLARAASLAPAAAVAVAALGTVLLALPVLWWRVVRPLEAIECDAAELAGSCESAGDDFDRLDACLQALRSRQAELVAALERKADQVDQLATNDPVTGLANRTLLRELFPHQAAAARRARTPMALLIVDLDHFRTVNDTLGHRVGDEVLRVAGRRIVVALRESDFVCRLGGDEYAVLLPAAEGFDQVSRIAERLLAAIAEPIAVDASGQSVHLTASIGVSMYPSDAGDFEAVVRTAEIAMYRSKQLGRARYGFYHPDHDASLRERASLERELLRALAEREFVLHYQPLVDAASGRLCAAEALLRWQHPRRGLLEPAAFIDAAEHAGLMREVGLWTIDTACRQLAEWQRRGSAPARIAVNLSARQALDAALPAAVKEALARHRLQPAQLELEMRENALAGDSETTARAAARLRALGVALTIDDFGTGSASLTTLQALRPDRLKIDRAFVARLASGDDALPAALIGMARALAIGVVGEGVETEAQRDWLLRHGCTLQQGFLYGQPMPPTAFERLLSERYGEALSLPA